MVLLRLMAFKPQDAQVAGRAEKKTLKTVETVRTRPEPERTMPAPSERVVATQPPPGQHLPVVVGARTAPLPSENKLNQDLVQDQRAQSASKIIAIQVRESAETRADMAVSGQVAGQLQPTEEGGFWHLTVQQLVVSEAINALVRELALQSQLVARDIDHWLLRVERESLNQPASRERLQSALQSIGHVIKLSVEVGRVVDSPAKRNAAVAAERQIAAAKIIDEDPFVQSMVRDFGAKIVPGSIKPIL